MQPRTPECHSKRQVDHHPGRKPIQLPQARLRFTGRRRINEWPFAEWKAARDRGNCALMLGTAKQHRRDDMSVTVPACHSFGGQAQSPAAWHAGCEIVAETEGVVVTGVQRVGAAASAGLRPGDVIISVGNTEVVDEIEFRNVLSQNDIQRGIWMQVISEGVRRFVFVRAK